MFSIAYYVPFSKMSALLDVFFLSIAQHEVAPCGRPNTKIYLRKNDPLPMLHRCPSRLITYTVPITHGYLQKRSQTSSSSAPSVLSCSKGLSVRSFPGSHMHVARSTKSVWFILIYTFTYS